MSAIRSKADILGAIGTSALCQFRTYEPQQNGMFVGWSGRQRCRSSSSGILGKNNGNVLDLGIGSIAIDDHLCDQNEITRRQLTPEVDVKICIGGKGDLASAHDVTLAVRHHIAAFGG